MKQKLIQPALILACGAVFAACSNDDDNLRTTRVNGMPSSIKYRDNDNEDKQVYFYYQDNRLSRIKEIKGSIMDFNYEDNELASVSTSPEDKNVMDGHGSSSFRKEGSNKIIIESSGEPSFDVYRIELELDDNNFPVKATETGLFSITGPNQLTKVWDGKNYAVFEYDRTTRNLIKQTVYDKKTSDVVATYTYEYDNNPGALSRMELPLWYYAYRAYGNRDYNYNYSSLFFNYANNLLKETINKEETSEADITNYIYQYNNNNTPIVMDNDKNEVKNMTITY